MKKSLAKDIEAQKLIASLDTPSVVQAYSKAIHYEICHIGNANKTIREQLDLIDSNAKTSLGGLIERRVRMILDWKQGIKNDYRIDDIEVEAKWSIGNSWMIGRQQLDSLCLLSSLDRDLTGFNLGIFRAREEYLNAGANQDKKRTISKAGKEQILWLAESSPLPTGSDSVKAYVSTEMDRLKDQYGIDLKVAK